MRIRQAVLVAAGSAMLVVGLTAGAPAARAAGAPAVAQPIEQVFHDIETLRFLGSLHLSRQQLSGFLKLAQEVAAKGRPGPPDTPEVRAALADIRQALLEERDPEGLDQLYQRLEKLIGGEDGEGGRERAFQEAVAAAAGKAVNLLHADQLTRLLGGGEDDDRPGAAAPLVEAAHRLRGVPAPRRAAAVAETALRLANRFSKDVGRTGKIRAELEAWLKKALALPEDQFEQQIGRLTPEAERILERAAGSAFALLRLRAEGRLADLLHNPRLPALLKEKLALAEQQ